ncbi:MAG TPA: hypothetical protein DF610_19615 [Sphingobacterium sp.]|nr:hypothetical protein [Sphingobacterium sp.]
MVIHMSYGILKVDFRLDRLFKSRAEALLATKSTINYFNSLRPHMNCDYLTPASCSLI